MRIPSVSIPNVRVLCVGDMFFDRYIRQVGDRLGSDFVFSQIDGLLHSVDMVVGNLEGPITDHSSVSVGTIPGSPNNYRFTFPARSAAALLRHNVKIVSLGNNHILNFGRDGLTQTKRSLTEAGVGFFGGVDGDEPAYRTDANGVSLSFVGYNQFGGAAPAKVAEVVRNETEARRVTIVFCHWGAEYSTSTANIREAAVLFSQSGAAAIVGAHPHVVGPRDQHDNTCIYYSLGNFIFDQYFTPDVMRGLAVTLTISAQGVVSCDEHPLHLELDGRTCVA